MLAEREGFEPPIGLHLCRISSAVHSTTLPPLRDSNFNRLADREKDQNRKLAPDWHRTSQRRGPRSFCRFRQQTLQHRGDARSSDFTRCAECDGGRAVAQTAGSRHHVDSVCDQARGVVVAQGMEASLDAEPSGCAFPCLADRVAGLKQGRCRSETSRRWLSPVRGMLSVLHLHPVIPAGPF